MPPPGVIFTRVKPSLGRHCIHCKAAYKQKELIPRAVTEIVKLQIMQIMAPEKIMAQKDGICEFIEGYLIPLGSCKYLATALMNS